MNILNTFRVCKCEGTEVFKFGFPVVRLLNGKHVYILPEFDNYIPDKYQSFRGEKAGIIMNYVFPPGYRMEILFEAATVFEFFIEWCDIDMLRTTNISYHHLN